MRAQSVSVDISPESQVSLGAADVGKNAWIGVTEKIEANLLALWSENDGMPVLMISVDLLYPGRILRAAIEAAAEHLDPDHIFLAASHTHQAPMTDDTKPRFGLADTEYLAWLKDRISAGVQQVLRPGPTQSATISASRSEASHSINRRRFARFFLARRLIVNEFVTSPNPRGVTDESIVTATIKDSDGRPIALLWNYACHPVGFPLHNTVAAHYPHVIRESARKRLGDPHLPVLFFQGFSGNTRPSATAGAHSPRRRIRQLFSGRLFEDMTERGYADWSTSLAKKVTDSFEHERPVESNFIGTSRVIRDSADFAEPLGADVSFHGLRIGPEILILGVSGEAVAEYAPQVRNMGGAEFTFCVGCLDHTFGYIPTSQIMAEGGYEGGGFRGKFDLTSINPAIEDHTLKGFQAVLTGLPVPKPNRLEEEALHGPDSGH
ncbi:MAG: hypothetical protein QOE58_1959 [Actinomycetota bacterium]|nr:hypothetical protein [Actinomycetota bacterium]